VDAARPPKSANKTNDGSVAVWVLAALVLVSINLRPAVTTVADFRDGVRDDPLRTLLLNGTARQAVLSVVAGRTLMADGEIAGVDLGYWRRRGQELFDKMKVAYTLRDASRRTAAELFPPVYARVEH
jgi:hypothetical protein